MQPSSMHGGPGAGVPTTWPEGDVSGEASPGQCAAAHALDATDIVEAITSRVAEGDVLCWALVGPAFLAAARQIRPALWSGARITARAAPAFSPERLRWIVAGHVAMVVEGRCGADKELQAADEAIVESAVERAKELHKIWEAEVTAGAVMEAVLAAMEAHGGSAAVQARGCAALCNYANRARAAEAGAVEAVAAAMRAHGDDAGVQEKACSALENLVHDSPANLARAAEAGAIEAVVGAMQAHGGYAEVLKRACYVLGRLADCNYANQARAAEAGAVEAVAAAMQAHGDSTGMQENASFALRCLAKDNPANRARAAEAGAIEAVVAAMQAHEDEECLQEIACLALASLAEDSPANQARAGEAGAVEAVVAAMQAPWGEYVQELGQDALDILQQHCD